MTSHPSDTTSDPSDRGTPYHSNSGHGNSGHGNSEHGNSGPSVFESDAAARAAHVPVEPAAPETTEALEAAAANETADSAAPPEGLEFSDTPSFDLDDGAEPQAVRESDAMVDSEAAAFPAADAPPETEVVPEPEAVAEPEPVVEPVAVTETVTEPQADAESEAIAASEPFEEPGLAPAPPVAVAPVVIAVAPVTPIPMATTPEVATVPLVAVAPAVATAAPVAVIPEPGVVPATLEGESLAPLAPEPSRRLASLDALRGLDMLLIIGLEGIVLGLQELVNSGWLGAVAKPVAFVQNQLTHRPWEGLAVEDVIFPLFIFIVGVSVVLSVSKARATQTTGRVVTRIVIRTLLLYLLGLIVYGGFDQPLHAFAGQSRDSGGLHAVRWLGVLQRIAICYGVAALLFFFVRPRYIAIVTVLLLVAYWLLMSFANVHGVGRGLYAEGQNLANHLDQRFLGGYKWDGFDWDTEGKLRWDPEGYLSTLPAIATCLLGVFAGMTLRGDRFKPYAKFALLLLGGAALAALGYVWGVLPSVPSPIHMPVIKKLWTCSFVLLTGGISAMLLALFYLVIDVWRLRGWAAPFVWIGANAITLYILAELGGFYTVAARLVGGIPGRHQYHYHWPIWGPWQGLITALVVLAFVIALARFLYRRGVFIRV